MTNINRHLGRFLFFSSDPDTNQNETIELVLIDPTAWWDYLCLRLQFWSPQPLSGRIRTHQYLRSPASSAPGCLLIQFHWYWSWSNKVWLGQFKKSFKRFCLLTKILFIYNIFIQKDYKSLFVCLILSREHLDRLVSNEELIKVTGMRSAFLSICSVF